MHQRKAHAQEEKEEKARRQKKGAREVVGRGHGGGEFDDQEAGHEGPSHAGDAQEGAHDLRGGGGVGEERMAEHAGGGGRGGR